MTKTLREAALPQRWVDLILYLDEQERQRAHAETKARLAAALRVPNHELSRPVVIHSQIDPSGTKTTVGRLCAQGAKVWEYASMWQTLWDELREIAWLASVVGGLSALSVGIAVALAAA